MQSFYLRWQRPNGGRFIVAYIYDPLAPNQKGLTLAEWRARCIEFGEANNLTYQGEATAEQYQNEVPTPC
jgi:hypothetical protein